MRKVEHIKNEESKRLTEAYGKIKAKYGIKYATIWIKGVEWGTNEMLWVYDEVTKSKNKEVKL
jgi:hypothetical protein